MPSFAKVLAFSARGRGAPAARGRFFQRGANAARIVAPGIYLGAIFFLWLVNERKQFRLYGRAVAWCYCVGSR